MNINFIPIISGFLLSVIISVLGAPVFGYLWEPVNPASAVFAMTTAVMRIPKVKVGKNQFFLSIIVGIFVLDFGMSTFYVSSEPSNGLVLLIGSIMVLGLVCSFIPLTGKLKKDGFKYTLVSCSFMAATIFLFGIIYGGITPGVSDGPKLGAIISLIFLKAKKEAELDILWNVLFVMGILGNFIIPLIPVIGVLGETF